MPASAGLIKDFLLKHPTIASALIGGGMGAVGGKLLSDSGQEETGTRRGALLGAGLGALGGTVSHGLANAAPTPLTALIGGAVTGGAVGGFAGRKMLDPWMVEQLKHSLTGQEKEAQVSTVNKEQLTKQAELEKVASDRTTAFDFGMEQFLNQYKLDKVEFSKAAGVDSPDKLAEAAIIWLSNSLQKVD